MVMARALTIAGSDSGGGAGIQADLKTFLARGVYGASVITALTAQNTQGVQGILQVDPSFVAAQLDSVLSDIRFDALKTGMLANEPIINAVSARLEKYRQSLPPVVVDPVLVSTSGQQLLDGAALTALKTKILSLSTICTPNVPEVEALLDSQIDTESDVRMAALQLAQLGPKYVLIKGGHMISSPNSPESCTDVLYDRERDVFEAFSKPRVESLCTHGTGCTLSAAIAAELAKGTNMVQAVRFAKDYVYAAIVDGIQDLGSSGRGALHHGVGLKPLSRSWLPF
ncbi:Thiamine biosynthetic bifunctional enzyme TH1, chloroplastic [Porphyridium purpureum]|uniref:Thiamine biosynthetic bifunctional enzyme TH1, chloroplastic n=1 Tax=Porphyridium purpureum TaxID=35688 RepID=A0A5J4YUS3_PORPP|nr:Thiamine biosynthetic bifunctional enzyme TH1, chloroplastic [Porphyridium purpureum]|eukprot:POR4902..scf209_3